MNNILVIISQRQTRLSKVSSHYSCSPSPRIIFYFYLRPPVLKKGISQQLQVPEKNDSQEWVRIVSFSICYHTKQSVQSSGHYGRCREQRQPQGKFPYFFLFRNQLAKSWQFLQLLAMQLSHFDFSSGRIPSRTIQQYTLSRPLYYGSPLLHMCFKSSRSICGARSTSAIDPSLSTILLFLFLERMASIISEISLSHMLIGCLVGELGVVSDSINILRVFSIIQQSAEQMFDSKSTSSLGQSINSLLASANLNPLASVHPTIINKIKKEVEVYENASSKCESIWEALKKNSIDGFQLSEKVIESIFKEFQTDLHNMTKITSLKEFMRIFDTDRDGILNEDQQIQIFCFIKERMERVANNAIKIQLYTSFKNLMKEVRQLQCKITLWQEHLRDKVHHQQIVSYRKIGQDKIDKFWEDYDKQFENLNRLKIQRREAFQKQVLQESQRLQEKLASVSQMMKVKPNSKIRDLQFHEKLISLEQRIDEALDLRKELNDLEIFEKERVDKFLNANIQHQRQNLRKKHEKGRKELQQKLQEIELKLVIKIKRQLDIIQKKNRIHQNQISRIQTLSAKWAIRKGTVQPELKRTKKLQKQRNEIISSYKRAIRKCAIDDLDCQGNSQILPPSNNSTSRSKQSSFSMNKILLCTTNFEITKKTQFEIPVNKCNTSNRDFNTRITRYLMPLKQKNQLSLCELYDENLQQKGKLNFTNSQIERQQKSRKKNLLMSKIK